MSLNEITSALPFFARFSFLCSFVLLNYAPTFQPGRVHSFSPLGTTLMATRFMLINAEIKRRAETFLRLSFNSVVRLGQLFSVFSSTKSTLNP